MTSDLRNLPAEVVGRLRDGFGDDYVGTVDNRKHSGLWIDYRARALEHRIVNEIEVRDDSDGNPILSGYASVYDHPYEVAGGAPTGWTEIITRGAADKAVAEQDDVFLLYDHAGKPFARTRSGTLRLESDRYGLRVEANMDRHDPQAMGVIRSIQRGDLDAMSFAFSAVRQDWNSDYTERTISEVRLFDVSVVSFPANPATVVMARSNTEPAAAEAGRSLSLARAQAERLRLASV